MLFVSELVLLFISVTFAFDSLDPPVEPPIDGSKFAFIRAPYVNTLKFHKDLAVEDDVSTRWPNGIVRYYVDKQSYDDIFEALLRLPIHIIRRSSCIDFMNITDPPSDNNNTHNTPWINITNPRKEQNCNHEPRFKNNGEIELVFGYDCLSTNEMLHTLLHGIGVKDEVTHPHRDKYIRILWDNIQPAYQHLYHMRAVKSSSPVFEYDPLSVMHFHSRAFSKNGHATIAPLEPGLVISPSDTLSQLDKMRLQIYFGHECKKRQITNLLNTCKKSLGPKYLSKTKLSLCGENGREIDTEEKAEEEEVKNYQGEDINETEGQVAESLDVEGSDVQVQGDEALGSDGPNAEGQTAEEQNEEEQNAESQNAEEQNAESQNAEEQNAESQNTDSQNTDSKNANDQVEEGTIAKGKSSKMEDAGSHEEGSEDNENAAGESDKENEEVLNAGTENPDKMESEKNEHNITNVKLLKLSYKQKSKEILDEDSDEDSGENAVLSQEKLKNDKKQFSSGEHDWYPQG